MDYGAIRDFVASLLDNEAEVVRDALRKKGSNRSTCSWLTAVSDMEYSKVGKSKTEISSFG